MNYWLRHQKQHSENYLELPEETRKALQVTHPRKEVTQRYTVYEKRLIDIIEAAKEFAEEWNKDINDVELDHYIEPHEYGDGSNSALRMTVEALETDEQYFARLMERHRATQARDENDRKEFERLKARFGA